MNDFGRGLHHFLRRSGEILEASLEAVPEVVMEDAVEACVRALSADHPLLVCGNGGSAADAMHIVGEFVGRFLEERKAIRAICLADNPSVLTAWSNDYDFASVFARQVEAYGEPGGVILGISTSGNSENIVQAFAKAKAMGMTTIALTGEGGGKMAISSDHLMAVPSRSTPLIQQVHICLYHYLCATIETRMLDHWRRQTTAKP